MKLGSLCSGAGGLDMAVEQVFGATTAWHCELNPAASRVLAHRWPGTPNHHDLINTDWATVEPIDILTAGYPCQPFSQAGKRKGANDDRHLWPHVREAIRRLRPRLTVLENVAGHRSMGFDRVLGDLAEDGLHVRWTSVRAADVGAPHGRDRLFIAVAPHSRCIGLGGSAERDLKQAARIATPFGEDVDGRAVAHGDQVALLPTPTARDGKGPCNRPGRTARPDNGRIRLPGDDSLPDAIERNYGTQWGKYAAAIERWEAVSRPAPTPAEPNTKGNPRLNPAFSEWLMGWPAGWVTAVPGLSRNDQLRIIGNGVVPQQAAAALTSLLAIEVAA